MSIREIAKMTGLSTTTVSHTINGTRVVSEKSKRLIEGAIKQIGYRPNAAARSMKTNRSNTIAVIIPSTDRNNSTNCFFFDVLNGSREFLQKKDYSLIVSTYDEQENSLATISVLKRQWIDGALLVPNDYSIDSKTLEDMIGVPIVLVDRGIENTNLPMVYSDNFNITSDAIKLLHQSGKRKIAYLGGRLSMSTALDRYNGYCQALQELGLSIEPTLIRNQLKYEIEAGFNATQQILQNGADAIFASNSVLSMGMLQYLIPYDKADQIALVGFDDYDWANIVRPPLTTVRQNPYLLGWKGAEMLLNIINNQPVQQKKVIIDSELIRRGL